MVGLGALEPLTSALSARLGAHLEQYQHALNRPLKTYLTRTSPLSSPVVIWYGL